MNIDVPSSTAPRTLYADWLLRRERIKGDTAAGVPYRDDQIRVLEYLLQRYRDSDFAQQRAAFPVNAEAHFDHRAMVVHHHVGLGQFGGIKTEGEARTRSARILGRIADLKLQDDAKAPGSNMPMGELLKLPNITAPFRQKGTWRMFGVNASLNFGAPAWLVLSQIAASQKRSPHLSRQAIDFLVELLTDPKHDHLSRRAAQIFRHSVNPGLLKYSAIVWRERVARNGDDLAARMVARLMRTLQPVSTAEKFRCALADGSSKVRIRAAIMLTFVGTAQDVGLLMDLLALPMADDEGKHERRWLVRALNRLAAKSGT
jgi:hypothetical protein